MTLSKFDQLSTSYVPKNSRVLDLGSNDGHIGKYLIKNLKCHVVGVEIDKKLASISRKSLNEVIIGDLENKMVQQEIFKKQKFDVIFASAILEHLKQPQIILQQLKKTLKKSSIIIINLPNIAHWSIRLNLLFGNFNYTKSGILDKTHLKFFTVKTALRFLEKECDLKIKTVDYDLPEVPIFSKLAKLIITKKCQEKIFRSFPNLFAYQVLVVAKTK